MNKTRIVQVLSLVFIVVLSFTITGRLLPFDLGSVVYAGGPLNAAPPNQVSEIIKAYELPLFTSQDQKFATDSEDGKFNVIIGFSENNNKEYQRRALVESFGGDIERGFSIINAVSASLPLRAVEALSKRDEVLYVEPDYEVYLISQQVPWGIDRVFGPENYTFPTWDNSRGEGVAVAVLDTGIDEGHVDLPNLLGGTNTIDSTHWASDNHGHGTHVAGIIAAVDNQTGVVGVSPSAGLYSIKVLDESGKGTSSSVISGIEWAHNKNIPIINMSFGGLSHSNALKDALDAAYDGGALLIASAGNNGDSTGHIFYPARYSSVIAVSASDGDDRLASFSSRGTCIELIAPGLNILSLYPGNHMVRKSGTSMAAPHVSGSAAVLWGTDYSLTNVEIRELLQETAQDLGLDEEHQGYGLVRVDSAVERIINSTSDAKLSSLTVNKGTLQPYFSSRITEYELDVAHDVDSVEVVANLSNEKDSIFISGEEATSGKPKLIVLKLPGTSTEIDIAVNTENGKAEKIYTITVNRALETTFTDVSPAMQFYPYIEAIYAEGITTGYSDGTFRPADVVTRSQMAAFLSRALELPGAGDPNNPSFNDVSPAMQFFGYIEAIYADGITTGYGDGTFGPDDLVTRGQMAAFIARALELPDAGDPDNSTFTDVSPSMQFFDYIEAIYAKDITTGYWDNTYRPDDTVTRGQMAAFLSRALDLTD